MESYEQLRGNLESLKRVRRNVRGTLTRFHNYVCEMKEKRNEMVEEDKCTLRARVDVNAHLLRNFENLQVLIGECSEDDVCDNDYAEFETKYFAAIGLANALLLPCVVEQPGIDQTTVIPHDMSAAEPVTPENPDGQLVTAGGTAASPAGALAIPATTSAAGAEGSSAASTSTLTESSFVTVAEPAVPSIGPARMHSSYRLPPIEMPTFDGTSGRWIEFKDLFAALVQRRADYTNVEKFCYLRSCLRGEAANLVKSLQTTEANFELAWKKLCDRYDDQQCLKGGHINAIIYYPRLTMESAASLRKLVDDVKAHMHALDTLGHTIQPTDAVILHTILDKLDEQTQRDWEFEGKDAPTIDEVLKYIQRKAALLDRLEKRIASQGQTENLKPVCKDKQQRFPMLKPTTSKTYINRNVYTATSEESKGERSCGFGGGYSGSDNTSGGCSGGCSGGRSSNAQHGKGSNVKTSICVFCDKQHESSDCYKFVNAAIERRFEMLNDVRACANCLRKGHIAMACYLKTRCDVCKKRHHRLLHREQGKMDVMPPTTAVCGNVKQDGEFVGLSHISVLPTVMVFVQAQNGKMMPVRALLDSGSQSHVISLACARRLQLQTKPANLRITGIGGQTCRSAESGSITICAVGGGYKRTLPCIVFDSITAPMPSVPLNRSALQIPDDITLADSKFDQPARVDLLLGVDILWECLLPGVITLAIPGTCLRNSRFGWLVAGKMLSQCVQSYRSIAALHVVVTDPDLERFWKQEEVNVPDSLLTAEELACEKLFDETTVRDAQGRFVVRLSRQGDGKVATNNSRENAEKRMYAIESRFKRNDKVREMYCDFMQEYLSMGHMSVVKDGADKLNRYFLPHHNVMKEESTTTKLRVVFDASCSLRDGTSLNDILLRGPVLQEDVLALLLRFRTHKYVVTADIAKMYRQILVNSADRRFQCILWRNSPREPLVAYELNTVTYGTRPASYLATKCLQMSANACDDDRIKRTIIRDFYVDDMITGGDDVNSLRDVCLGVRDVLQQHGFPLRKWRSNVPELCDDGTHEDLHLMQKDQAKTLGLAWRSRTDEFLHCCDVGDTTVKGLTKRKALSVISRIFDPLGLLAPAVIVAKRFMQQLWVISCDWDDVLPSATCEEFAVFLKQLMFLKEGHIPRLVALNMQYTLHIFTDASEHAFCAAVYVRSAMKGEREVCRGCESDESCKNVYCVRLMCAKTRLAPLKSSTVPRLELCGALLGVKLAILVCKALGKSVMEACSFYTDSTIVLAWLQTMPNKLKTFASHRVAAIQEETCITQWQHVRGIDNPADLGTRGISGAELNKSELWWSGPLMLRRCLRVMSIKQVELPDEVPETRVLMCVMKSDVVVEFDRFSSFVKLVNSVAYVLRFTRNARCLKTERQIGPLRVEELRRARQMVFLLLQQQTYASELKLLNCGEPVSTKSEIRQLTPFVGPTGLLRMQGRLANSGVSYDEMHPVILPPKHHVTRLLLEHVHRVTLHGGPQQVVNESRRWVWIPRAKSLARNVYQKCVRCFRLKPTNKPPMMGHLPTVRTELALPFCKVGVDYAGPLTLLSSHLRNSKQYKAWICVYVCMVTRATHLELVTELSTAAFLSCFRRFVSRRGVPQCVYSDNGTNFVGACKELRSLFAGTSADEIVATAAQRGCDWKFIPPSAPHFGGLWEAAVKSTKHHLNRVLRNSVLTYEEVYTVLCEIEGILNSRPLCPLTDDPSDFQPLTPAHFLIGRALHSVPYVCESNCTVRIRFRRSQGHVRAFWQQWRTAYLRSLQLRRKWRDDGGTMISIGDLVLVQHDALPPAQWLLARVEEVHPGGDRIVRVATIRFASGTRAQRPVVKLYKLPVDDGNALEEPAKNEEGVEMSEDKEERV